LVGVTPGLFAKIADLAKFRFREGQQLSAVERMVVSNDEQVNQLQVCVWRQFCDGRRIEEYLA